MRRTPQPASIALLAPVLALGLVLINCSDDGTGPGDGNDSTVIAGALAATDGTTGLLSLTSAAAVSLARAEPSLAMSAHVTASAEIISLTGTATLSDGTIADLTGSWDTETGEFSVSGDGFSFAGTMEDGSLTDTFTGPSITGLFSLQVGAPSDLGVYCGTFTGRQPEDLPDGGDGTAPSNGTWNLVVGPSTVQLIGIAGEEGTPILAEGSRSGATVTISVPGGSATGTLTGGDDEFVNGEYATAGGDAGEFHGSIAACTATAETGTIASLVINAPGLLPGNGRLAFDSSLTYVTALDADGNYVAAPDLTWTFPAADQFLRTNSEATLPGQKWVVAQSPLPPAQGTGEPPELVTRTFTVASVNRPGVTATGTVVVYWYW
jgi:hypothetical protein